MSEIKTKINDASVIDFINTIPDETKRKDSLTLLELFSKATGHEAKMWGAAIIGFDQYHYKSERSSQEGDWPIVAFSPRKQTLTLYLTTNFEKYTDLLDKLGKHTTSKACLYINKLSDVDQTVLEEFIRASYKDSRHELVDSKN